MILAQALFIASGAAAHIGIVRNLRASLKKRTPSKPTEVASLDI